VQGIEKKGFVSSRLDGLPLSFGPLEPPPLAKMWPCAGLVVSLGYLVSWAPGMGALSISCEGCPCTRIKGMYAPQMSPFPFIETSTRALHIGNELAGRNVTVTYTTTFWMRWDRSQHCFVNVRHVRGSTNAGGKKSSKVRIDSLYVRSADRDAIAFARVEDARTRLANRTTDWKRWGEFSHACEAQATVRERAHSHGVGGSSIKG